MLPLPCEMIQFDKYAFSMGWNHQNSVLNGIPASYIKCFVDVLFVFIFINLCVIVSCQKNIFIKHSETINRKLDFGGSTAATVGMEWITPINVPPLNPWVLLHCTGTDWRLYIYIYCIYTRSSRVCEKKKVPHAPALSLFSICILNVKVCSTYTFI